MTHQVIERKDNYVWILLRKGFPVIYISKKKEKSLFGREKIVPRSKKEQRKLKAELVKQHPDRFFGDNLGWYISIKHGDGS